VSREDVLKVDDARERRLSLTARVRRDGNDSDTIVSRPPDGIPERAPLADCIEPHRLREDGVLGDRHRRARDEVSQVLLLAQPILQRRERADVHPRIRPVIFRGRILLVDAKVDGVLPLEDNECELPTS
jgi:hypothetical protein